MMLRDPPLVEMATGNIFGTSLRDKLAQEDSVGPNVVGDGGDVGWFESQRNRGNRFKAERRQHAVDGQIVSVGGRAAIAEDDQLAAALQALVNRQRVLPICSDSSRATWARSLASSCTFIRIDAATSATRSVVPCFSRPRNG